MTYVIVMKSLWSILREAHSEVLACINIALSRCFAKEKLRCFFHTTNQSVTRKLIQNLRKRLQRYSPTLLGVYASGWKRFTERRRTYLKANDRKVRVLIGPAWEATRLSNPNFYFLDTLFRVERRLGTRGWCIDPIVDHLNRFSDEFVCDTYMNEHELISRPADIVFVCKVLDDLSLETLQELKTKGVKLVYSIVDNSRYQTKCYIDHPEYLKLFDHIMLASPVQEEDIASLGIPFSYVPTPCDKY